MRSGFHWIWMVLRHKSFTAFTTKFWIYEYMVTHSGLANVPATFLRDINQIRGPGLGIELVVHTKIELDKDDWMVVITYIDNIMIATRGSIEKHLRQVSKVFQITMDSNMCNRMEKCIFDAVDARLVGFMVSGKGLRMDPDKSKAIVNRPRSTSQKEVQQILGLWNYYRSFVQSYATIGAPISDQLRRDWNNFHLGEAHEAAFLRITILCTSGKTPISRDDDQDRPE